MASKLRNRLSAAAGYYLRRAVLTGGPVEIMLESTARCNLYCPMCPRHVYNFDNESMDLELYRRIVEDCKTYVEFIWPYGIGEPMLHPGIFEMIRLTREAGIRTGLSTNATLLDESRADLLLNTGLDYIILAFDGASKRTYEKYRAGATFERTRENILGFLRKKKRRGDCIHVVLQMVVLEDNVHEIEDYRKLWSIDGVDEIRFKRDEIRVKGACGPDPELKGPRTRPCHMPWRGPLYVRYDGLAYPCCYMYEQPPIGDLRTQSVMEVWNSPGMVKLRSAHLAGDLAEFPVCASCQAARPSSPAIYGSFVFDSLRVRKAVPAMEKLSRFYKLAVVE